MTPKPTALIIGAGIGGIATAGRLARQGYDVTRSFEAVTASTLVRPCS
jgi:cation diffusion facilitator CzcD-associated flavoprotein CzcO